MYTDHGIPITVFLHIIIVLFTIDHTDNFIHRLGIRIQGRILIITDAHQQLLADEVHRLTEAVF